MTLLLNQDNDQVSRMEQDLRAKLQAAIDCTPDLNMGVYGIFSLDDLERQLENDFGGGIGVGVQYSHCERIDGDSRPGASGARALRYFFQIILAVPCGQEAAERHDATKLLTMLRRAVHNKAVIGDPTTPRWDFVSERAEHGASTATMLYYSQLWQLALPLAAA